MSYHLGITLGFESQYVVQMSCTEKEIKEQIGKHCHICWAITLCLAMFSYLIIHNRKKN